MPLPTNRKPIRTVRNFSIVKNIRTYWMFYAMMLPGIVLLVINNYIPLFGIVIAFKTINYQDGILGSPWTGMKNFEYLFASKDSYIIIRNTLLYNSLFIVLNMALPLGFALMLNEMKNRFLSKLHQTIMFLPYFLSMIVISYLVYGFMSDERGYFNGTLLPALGLDSVRWYFTKEVY